MLARSAEPVFGVAVVRFATMQNRMEAGAVRVLPVLHNLVSRVEMIMPEQRHGAEEWSPRRRRRDAIQEAIDGGIDLISRPGSWPGAGSEIGWFSRREKLARFSKQ
jgi:hypothetical protein